MAKTGERIHKALGGALSNSDICAMTEAELEEAFVTRESERAKLGRCPGGFEKIAAGRPYQLCRTTVMDTTDPEISFENGVSSWARNFEREVLAVLGSADDRKERLELALDQIRRDGRGRDYDCVIGLSGGVDSSYMCVLAVQLGLRPLIVHFDNGWNSELAVQNIESLVRELKLDLHTLVMDWPEFRDLQRSYFKASVIDLEVPTDHMIFGSLYKSASQHGIRWILSGTNLATEWVLPRSWYYPKQDLTNLRGIQRRFGTVRLRHLPALGVAESAWYHQVRRIRSVSFLNLLEYDKPAAKRQLMAQYGWRDYGGKHHESVFTRFYQGHILPTKFNVDKRKAHLSNLILMGQCSRRDALFELLQPPYSPATVKEDFRFVAKKLGFSEQEFSDILRQPNRSHAEFGSDERVRKAYQRALEAGGRVRDALRPRRPNG